MTGEFAISVYLTTGISGVLAVGLTFPPLTTSTGALTLPVEQVENISQEFEYCQSNLSGMDCMCFANKSGHILSHDRPQLPGVVYIAKYGWAREQAAQACG